MAGVYTDQRLNLPNPWEGPRKKCQGFKPDSGNLTVRDYRGASGIVSHGEDGNPSGNRKSRNGNPSPTAERARFLSQWGGLPTILQAFFFVSSRPFVRYTFFILII